MAATLSPIPGSDAVEWPRVARAVFAVRQHYRYAYSGPVSNVEQRLLMVPPRLHGDQRLVSHRLDVRGAAPAAAVVWERDTWGNRVCRVHADVVRHAIDFEVQYTVERSRVAAGGPEPWPDEQRFLRPTGLTAPDARLRAAAADVAARAASPGERAERAHDWAAGAIDYQLGLTGVHTPAAMALHLGKGVCQDYAHIMLCILRLLGIPARYVSGHLLGHGAPHAWVEALVDGGAVVYDPTHQRRGGLTYITVATARDFADVTPTSGVFTGPATGQLSATKQAEVIEVEYADRDDPGAAAGEVAA